VGRSTFFNASNLQLGQPTTMPRKTKKSRAAELGITFNVLNNASNQGVDIWQDKAMLKWLETNRPRVPADAAIPAGDSAMDAHTIEAIKDEITKATDYNTVKILNEKLKGIQMAVKVQKETGELVGRDAMRENDTRIGAVVKAGVLKLCNDAAPVVEGLDAAAAHKVLRLQGDEILNMMADEQGAFWKGLDDL